MKLCQAGEQWAVESENEAMSGRRAVDSGV